MPCPAHCGCYKMLRCTMPCKCRGAHQWRHAWEIRCVCSNEAITESWHVLLTHSPSHGCTIKLKPQLVSLTINRGRSSTHRRGSIGRKLCPHRIGNDRQVSISRSKDLPEEQKGQQTNERCVSETERLCAPQRSKHAAQAQRSLRSTEAGHRWQRSLPVRERT